MNNMDNSSKDNFTYRIFQLIVWVIILILIIVRILNYTVTSNEWIWIVNYIGMGIAFINLFIDKCFQLNDKSSKKYKPFTGFTVFISIIVCIICIPVYRLQSCDYSQTINDVITLFALFFSLSHTIWDSILNIIVNLLKK